MKGPTGIGVRLFSEFVLGPAGRGGPLSEAERPAAGRPGVTLSEVKRRGGAFALRVTSSLLLALVSLARPSRAQFEDTLATDSLAADTAKSTERYLRAMEQAEVRGAGHAAAPRAGTAAGAHARRLHPRFDRLDERCDGE